MELPESGTLLRPAFQSGSPGDTFRIGRDLGKLLAGAGGGPFRARAAVLALIGELGSGKTVFTKGVAAGIGVSAPDRVTSPTFVIRQDYEGSLRMHHYDVYRLSGPAELLSLGFEEDLEPGTVVVVEWADRVSDAVPPEALSVEFEHAPVPEGQVPGTSIGDPGRRRITFRGDPTIWSEIIGHLFASQPGR
jgi:tRNA threonylcarbamoyladenosine biosynthesis protein TsaE